MPWRETPDPELFQELLDHMDARYERFEGTDPHPSEFCPDCETPPFRPHEEGCACA